MVNAKDTGVYMRFFLRYWLPVLIWLVVIFVGSSDLLSAEHTSRFIGPFLRWFVPEITDAAIASVQFLVRKCAHLMEYAFLAVLLWRAFHQHHASYWRTRAMALVVAAACASLDEFHQSYFASRTGSFWDVLIDCAGAILGLAIYRGFSGESLAKTKRGSSNA